MSRHTGNRAVVEKLQQALTEFLDDHRKDAERDPEWIADTSGPEPEVGCGCGDCELAAELRGSIY
jgi:hypothetical protein